LSFHCVIGQVEVPDGKYPYHTYIEWPGNGGLFINSDPTEKARDFNMSFINKNGELQWQETIYPKTFDVTPIVSKASNYLYFFDKLEIEKNKLYYHQINSNGSVKSTSVDFLRDLKQMGYNNPDDALIQNIINTEKALVFQLLLENKSEKVYDHVLVFLTHHNHRIYAVKMTPTNFNNFKADYTGVPYFAGSEGNSIYFAQLSNAGGKPKVTFFPFNEKGSPSNEMTLSIPNYKPLETDFKTYIPDGYNEIKGVPYYSEKLGFAFFSKGHFYFSQINGDNHNLELMRYTEKGEFETVYSSEEFEPEKKRFSVEKSLYFNGAEWVIFASVATKKTMVQILGENITKVSVEKDLGDHPKFNHTQLLKTGHTDKHLLPIEKGMLYLPKKELPKKDNLILKTL
jgi:hypothetical protein